MIKIGDCRLNRIDRMTEKYTGKKADAIPTAFGIGTTDLIVN